MTELEPVFFATTAHDEAAAEKVLDGTGVDYAARVEVIEERRASGVCYQGMLYEVPAAEAAKCRELLVKSGLQRGIVDANTRMR